MADFQGYLCWKPEVAAATINTEAVSPSRAVFLATHTPLRVRRAKLQGGSKSDAKSLEFDDRTLDEEAVLQDFLTRKSDTGALLMPVVGDSGAGKSHLVRWAGEKIEEDDRRKVIYLEKGKTSLKAVVKELLADIDTPVGAGLRAEIDRFTTNLDEPALARRLLNSLEEALSGTTSHNITGPPRVLRGPTGLAVILQDPHVRQHMLSPGRFIPQLAHQLLEDRRDGEEQRPERFSLTDLPLDIDDIQQTAAMTKRMLNILSTNPELAGAAVDLLNEHLEPAVKQAFNLSAGSLTDAMISVRQEYAARGQEIILLIEDFALIQGMQRDLLDAMIEPANRAGKAVLSPIRTLMAVTTGYFQELPETVLTRIHATIGYVYDLDAPFGEGDKGTDHISSFVGRYLNAARIGSEGLQRVDDGADVSNACEHCDFRAQCHAGFGATEEGYGMYPFNHPALLRAVHSSAPRRDPYRFVPRNVLGGVVRQVLVEYADAIEDGQFPNSAFRADFPIAQIDKSLSSSVLAKVDSLGEVNPEQRKLLLEFWGDAPDTVDAVNSTITRAFGLPPVVEDGGGRVTQPGDDSIPGRSDETREEPKPGSGLPPSLVAKLNNVEEWVTRDVELSQDVAREIRAVVSESVPQRYSWSAPLMKEIGKNGMNGWGKAWPNSAATTSIEDAKGEGATGAGRAPIRFTKKAVNSQFFQSILRLKSGHPPVYAEDVYRLSSLAEEKSSAFTEALHEHLHIGDADLVLGLRASLLGAALAGRAYPGMEQADLLAVALDEGDSWGRVDGELRIDAWQATTRAHLSGRRALVQQIKNAVGVTQGIGAPRLIDAARVIPLLDEAVVTWGWSVDSQVPPWMSDAVTGFAGWQRLIDDQIAALEEFLRDIRGRHQRGTTAPQVVSAVRDAMTLAKEVGIPLSAAQAQEIGSLLSEAGRADWSAVIALEDDLGRIAASASESRNHGHVKVKAAVLDRGAGLAGIRRFLEVSEGWLDSALRASALMTGGGLDRSADELQSAVAEWADLSGARDGV